MTARPLIQHLTNEDLCDIRSFARRRWTELARQESESLARGAVVPAIAEAARRLLDDVLDELRRRR